MSAEINYKKKYFELRNRYINDMDMAYRLGMEQGAQQEQMNQMAQQQQQQAELQAAQAAGMGAQPGQPGAEGGEGAPPAPGMEDAGGSELDQHINQLEGMLKPQGSGAEGASGAPGGDPKAMAQMQKALDGIKSFRKSQLQAIEMRKSSEAIKGIAKALHRPAFKLSVNATHNMNDTAKRAVTMQEKVVTDIMSKWENEEKTMGNDITKILGIEGLTKKE